MRVLWSAPLALAFLFAVSAEGGIAPEPASPWARPLAYTSPAVPGGATWLVLVRSGDDLELRDASNGALLRQQPLAGTSHVAIHGADGDHDDMLTVDLSGGELDIPGGIDFDGGTDGFDVLELRGGFVATERHQHRGPDSGTISLDGLVIRYANLEPITDSTPSASYTINAPPAGAAISVTDGAAGMTRVTMTGAEAVDFQNKTAVTINGASIDTGWTINNPNPAIGLTSLTANGGSGNDTFSVTPSTTIPYAINGGNPIPPASPGDTLDVILSGTTSPFLAATPSAAGFFGTWTFGNRQTIVFTQLEISPTPVELQSFTVE